MMDDNIEKALVVLEQDEVDTLIHTLEEEMYQLEGAADISHLEEIHEKLMVLMRDDSNDYQVK